jgi:tetratricopeptide (TPR) repeat protein
MVHIPRMFRWLLLALFVASASSACAAQPAKPAPEALPSGGLSEVTLYELLLAEIALQRGEPELAAQTYLEVAKRTRDPRVARRTVEVATSARLNDLAVEAARIWEAMEPSSPQALQITAALLVADKRVEEAQPYLERLLSSEGVNIESGFLQLNRLLAGNPDKAANLRVVRALAAKHDALPQAHFAIAQAASAANDDDSAHAALRRALALKPDWELAAVLQAQLLQKRSPGEAARSLAAFLEKYPKANDVRMNYARALVLDKRFPEARKQFETLLASNPGNPDVVYAVGVLAFQLKDFQVAEANLKRLLGMDYRDPNGARYLLGQVAEEQKQWPRAIEWYRQIQNGDHALPARMRTANAMAKQGKVDEARGYLRRVEAGSDAEQVQLIIAEAQLLRDAGREDEAYDVLAQGLEKQPDQPELLYDIALTAEKLERYDVLEARLKKLIEVRPDHAHAFNALGYSLAERNLRLPEARKLIERALELSPQDHFIIDSFGWVLYRQGDLKGAARELRRAYNGRPDAEIGAHLGEVLWIMGERAEADKVWREALEASPENETLLKTIKRLRK